MFSFSPFAKEIRLLPRADRLQSRWCYECVKKAQAGRGERHCKGYEESSIGPAASIPLYPSLVVEGTALMSSEEIIRKSIGVPFMYIVQQR